MGVGDYNKSEGTYPAPIPMVAQSDRLVGIGNLDHDGGIQLLYIWGCRRGATTMDF